MTSTLHGPTDPAADDRMSRLHDEVRRLYRSHGTAMPFHSWAHVEFVHDTSSRFAAARGADRWLTEGAALVHDLDHLAIGGADPVATGRFRASMLDDCGFPARAIAAIEAVIDAAIEETRSPVTSPLGPEAAALCDADTVYRVLPLSPIAISHRFLTENGVSLRELAKRIVEEQRPLRERGIVFHDPRVDDRYRGWAEANLQLWAQVLDATAR